MKLRFLSLFVLLVSTAYGSEFVTVSHEINLKACLDNIVWEEHNYFNVGVCEITKRDRIGYQLLKGEIRSYHFGTTQLFIEGLLDGFKINVVDFGQGFPKISDVNAKLDQTGGRLIKSTLVKY